MDYINPNSAILHKMDVFKKTRWQVGTFPKKIDSMKKKNSRLS